MGVEKVPMYPAPMSDGAQLHQLMRQAEETLLLNTSFLPILIKANEWGIDIHFRSQAKDGYSLVVLEMVKEVGSRITAISTSIDPEVLAESIFHKRIG